MQQLVTHIGRILAVATLALAGLLAVNAAPAQAAAVNTIRWEVRGVSGAYLGYAQWFAAPTGGNGNGYLEAQDAYCDGDNGIIGALYRANGALVNLVSIRSCSGGMNWNAVKAPANGGPAYGEMITFKVCKLLPDGTWKDCHAAGARNQ